MAIKIEESWSNVLSEEFEKPYFQELIVFVKAEYASQTVFPKGKDIFRAFDECPFDEVKVVILGQDPYHGLGKQTDFVFRYMKALLFLLH